MPVFITWREKTRMATEGRDWVDFLQASWISVKCNCWWTSVLKNKVVRDLGNQRILQLLKSICSWKKFYKKFIKINRNIKLMYLFLKFVTFVEMETWIWWKVIVSGHFSKDTKSWKNCSHNYLNAIFWRKCLCLGEFTRLSVYWVVYQNVLHFYIILCLIKCWSLWVVMYNFNFMFKSVRWICDALETTGYCSRLLAIHSRLLLLLCDMLNVLIDCILKVLDFLVLFLGIQLHFYTCALYRGSDTRIQCQH